MSLKPVNGHLLIEPVKQDSFISGDNKYQEVGVVLEVTSGMRAFPDDFGGLKEGDKVFFDSYLAAKFPAGEDKYYWLVKWEDVRAIESADVA